MAFSLCVLRMPRAASVKLVGKCDVLVVSFETRNETLGNQRVAQDWLLYESDARCCC